MNKLILIVATSILLTACGKPKSQSQIVFERFGFETKGITFIDQTPTAVDSMWAKIRFTEDDGQAAICTLEYRTDFTRHEASCRKLTTSNILD